MTRLFLLRFASRAAADLWLVMLQDFVSGPDGVRYLRGVPRAVVYAPPGAPAEGAVPSDVVGFDALERGEGGGRAGRVRDRQSVTYYASSGAIDAARRAGYLVPPAGVIEAIDLPPGSTLIVGSSDDR